MLAAGVGREKDDSYAAFPVDGALCLGHSVFDYRRQSSLKFCVSVYRSVFLFVSKHGT